MIKWKRQYTMGRTIRRAYQVRALNQYASVWILYGKLDVDL